MYPNLSLCVKSLLGYAFNSALKSLYTNTITNSYLLVGYDRQTDQRTDNRSYRCNASGLNDCFFLQKLPLNHFWCLCIQGLRIEPSIDR